MSKLFFTIPSSATSCTHRLTCRFGRCFCTLCRGLHRRPAPFTREAKRLIYFYSARFSHFIDSLKLFFPFHNGLAKRFLCIFFKSVFYIGCSTNCVNRADKITEIINYFWVLFVHFDCFCKVFNTAS